jgi:trehalose-6-phosphate synthase
MIFSPTSKPSRTESTFCSRVRKWKPIVFLKRHYSHQEISCHYRAADLCLLSRFTGVAREFVDAVLINPYDIERTADAIRYALEIATDERRVRMQRMRKLVKEQNIYRWAGNLIADLCSVRIDYAHDSNESRVGRAATHSS